MLLRGAGRVLSLLTKTSSVSLAFQTLEMTYQVSTRAKMISKAEIGMQKKSVYLIISKLQIKVKST